MNETIRVQKGLTYGARGGFNCKRFAGELSINTFSKNNSTVEAVQAILDEIKRLRNEPPSQDELEKTRSYLLGSFPAQRETPQQLAGELWQQKYLDLPTDYFEQMLEAVADTTAAECQHVAQRHVRPDQLTIVVVGPAKLLQQDLEQIAPVTVVAKDET